MTFIILPLLVLTQLSLNNETTWQYGPEVIYNVAYQARIESRIPEYSKYIPNQMSVAQLKCRPRTTKILNCNLVTDHMRPKSFDNTQQSSITPMFDEAVHFEIRFNRLGIEDLVVPSSISPKSLDILRFVVNHLHTGIDLTNKTEGKYDKWETYTTGNCFTSYRIDFARVIGTNLENKHDELWNTWNPKMRTFITKKRNVDKCRYSTPYYLSDCENWRVDPQFAVSMISSISHITVDQSTFMSTTDTKVALKGLDETTAFIMHENMMVIFDSIVPAKDEIRKVENPSSAGIITGRWLDDKYSEDSKEDLE